jgi:transcriptional regulator with XRE-family HTH domain
MAEETDTANAGRTVHDSTLGPDEWTRVLMLGLPPLRKLRGLSQAELARRSGVHRRTIWLLEQLVADKPQPSAQTLLSLARAFGYVYVSDLWIALQSVIATDPGTPLVVSERVRRMVLALFDCTPQQHQFIEGITLCWAAQQQAQALGEAHVLDLDIILSRQ